MTEPNLQAIEWGKYLAGLPEEARAAANRDAQAAYSNALPDEELGKLPVHTLGEFLDTDFDIPPILVEPGLVVRGGLTAMIAKGGQGKTTLSFNRLVRWAMEKPLFEELPEVMRPTAPLRSVIVENEGAAWHTQKKLRKIIEGGGFTPDEIEAARQNVHVWGDGGWSQLRLDENDNIDLVKRAVETVEADILFLEPFRLLWRGEENSSTEMMKVLEAFYAIANEYNCAVMVTHHESKGTVEEGGFAMEKARGSSVFTDLGAVMERWAPSGKLYREWSLTKWRYDDAPAPIRMEFDREREGYRYVPENESVRKIVTTLLKSPGAWWTVESLAEELDETKDKVRRWANTAADENDKVKRTRVPGGGAMQYAISEGPDEDGGELPLT